MPPLSPPRCFWRVARSVRTSSIRRRPRTPATPRSRWRRGPSSTDAPTGQPQRFAKGRDVPARWWARFKSPALNALIERALDNNPTLQSAIATLRAAREQVYAQEGKFFPLVQANFNPTYQRTSTRPDADPGIGRQHLRAPYRAGRGIVYPRRLGSQPPHRRVADGAGRRAALSGRGGLSDAHRERGARRHYRGLAARPDRRHQRAHRHQHQDARRVPPAARSGLHQPQRSGGAGSRPGAGQGDAAAAAQGARPAAGSAGGAGRHLSQPTARGNHSSSPTCTCRPICR